MSPCRKRFVDGLTYWDEVNNLTKTGRVTDKAELGQGDAPYKLLYGNTGERDPTDALSFLPYVHNTDSYGYNSRVIPKGIPYETESWGELLNDRYHGKVAIVNAPTIGMTAVKADSGDMCRCAFAGLYSKKCQISEDFDYFGVDMKHALKKT